MKKVLLLVLALTIFCGNAFAAKQPEIDTSADCQKIYMETAMIPAVSKLGVSVVPKTTEFGTAFHNFPVELICGTRFKAVTIEAINLEFTNDTDNVVLVEWSKSAIFVNGESKGIPFLKGMKYKDAGNPSATPNTILPPHSQTTVYAALPIFEFCGGGWMSKGAIIRRDIGVKFDYYILLSANAENDYLAVNIPKLLIPKK